MRVLAVADSDSYIKWGASILKRMPPAWSRELVVIRTPALPSARQLTSVLANTGLSAEGVNLVDLADLGALVADGRPDAILLSVRGPVVRVLIRKIVEAGPHRPLLVSGLPGISIPATLLALYYRSQVDLMILHSAREIDEFGRLADSFGISQDFALATLPFLADLSVPAGNGTDIVFAAQAKVPRDIEDRERLLGWLADAARAHPHRLVIIKLRGLTGEPQTHSERFPFDVLVEAMDDRPDNLIVSTGSMRAHLETAAVLVTVSSTASIEAIAQGVPVLALDDFGVSPALINVVFEGSGMLGPARLLIAGEFPSPSAEWRESNYFHGQADDTWVAAIEAGVARRLEGPMPLRAPFRATLGGNLRRVWDRKRALGHYDRSVAGYLALAVGLPLVAAVRLSRRVRATARATLRPASRELAPATPTAPTG